MVLKLSMEGFEKSKNYLMKFGRDLEQELFRIHFENGNPQNLINLLQQYQGENGGFKNLGEGHRDIPNAMDTVMAFQYLSEVGATIDSEVVQKGVQYIIESYDGTYKCWHHRPNQVHTSWLDNPCAELLGYLYEYRELVPQEFLTEVTEHAMTSMSSIHTTNEVLQFYFLDALCLLRLATRIDEPYKTKILNQLRDEINLIIELDSNKWATTYCAKPFFFATSPNSPLYPLIREQVILSLENEVKTQSSDGHFILNWDCEDEEGERVWKSIWTIDAVKALFHHGMIENSR